MSISTKARKEGLVLISTGEHPCRVLPKQDAKEKDSRDPYAVVLQKKEKVLDDIKRLAIEGGVIDGETSVPTQEKQYKFNGQNLDEALEKFYNKNYKKTNENKPFLDYITDANSNVAQLIQDFFEADKDLQGMGLPLPLAELLMQTLSADAFLHRLGCALPTALFQGNRFIDNSALQREINICFDSNSNELNIYEQYSVQQTKNVDNMEGPAESSTLKTLSHVRVEMDSVTKKPKVFAEYYASASGADAQYAAAVIKEVTPEGQNPRNSGGEDTQGQTALHRAVLNNDLNLVRILLDGKLVENINAKDNQGKTALHYAAQQNNEAVVLALVDRGADLTLRDKRQKLAHQYAAKSTPVKQFLKALTLVEGYLKCEKGITVQDEQEMDSVRGMRDCLVEDAFYNCPTSIELRKAKLVEKMRNDNWTIEDELKGPKRNSVAAWFGQLIKSLAKILDLDFSKEQRQDIIVPQKGESHEEAFCNKLSAVVLNPERQRSRSEPALLRFSSPELRPSQSCPSLFFKGEKGGDERKTSRSDKMENKKSNRLTPSVYTLVHRPLRRP